MERKTRTGLPAALEELRQRVWEWRRNRIGRWVRMPDPLWQAAARLAKVHGINPVARALHLDYYNLKRRVDGGSGTAMVPQGPAPVFVEFGLPAGVGAGGVVLEFAARDGAKMVARIPDGSQLDLVALAEAFWRRRR